MVRRLVGIAEIAELLQVSRQRADQLSRTRSFPEAVRRVAPLGPPANEEIRELFDQLGTITLTQAMEELEERAFELPVHPRLWRLREVGEWARAEGRKVANLADLDWAGSGQNAGDAT